MEWNEIEVPMRRARATDRDYVIDIKEWSKGRFDISINGEDFHCLLDTMVEAKARATVYVANDRWRKPPLMTVEPSWFGTPTTESEL